MAMIVTGRRVAAEVGRVRYTYETTSSGGPMGSIWISVDDPSDWCIENDAPPTTMAVAVYETACARHATTGVWPEVVERFS